jgi:hypothetical protein
MMEMAAYMAKRAELTGNPWIEFLNMTLKGTFEMPLLSSLLAYL